MTSLQRWADGRPFIFVIALFIMQFVLALPFVFAFKVLDLDIVPLRLIIPIVHTAFMLWVVWRLGWFARAGFVGPVRDVQVLAYPALLTLVPWAVAGTVTIEPAWLLFYVLALIFTGLSEETFARGIVLPALQAKGKWTALFLAAALFSAGHFSNLAFEDFTVLDMTEKLSATFGFAVLYGAVFMRTGNIWPLIALHTLHDIAFLTSGTAGPYTEAPLPLALSFGISALNVAYGVWILRGVDWDMNVRTHAS